MKAVLLIGTEIYIYFSFTCVEFLRLAVQDKLVIFEVFRDTSDDWWDKPVAAGCTYQQSSRCEAGVSARVSLARRV